MKLIELPTVELEAAILNLPITAGGGSRTPSPAHVSNIIRDIENAVTKPGKRRPYDELSDAERKRLGNYASVGWAWEEALRRSLLAMGIGISYSEHIERVGELHLDDIYGTPDGINLVDWTVEEFKATWRSSRRPLDPDFWHWLVQIKSYCTLLRATQARLRIFYVNGDYRESGPQYKCYRLEFTELELEDNWDMLKNHAKSKGWI